jgi:hypothetical protein
MKPTNTAKQAHDDPLTTLFMTMGAGGIERQEAREQQELVNSASLPTECRGREALEAAGVKFGEPYKDDPLFCDAVLPTGWKKQATDHSMHSNLLDEKGRIRAKIFYKAAHYDRSADMYAERRYCVNGFIRCDATGKPTDEDYSTRPKNFLVAVMDGKQVIHSVGVVDADNGYHTRREFEEAGVEWLNNHFPEWESAAAYWD